MIGSTWRRSRRNTSTADMIRVTPKVKVTWTTSSTGTQTEVGLGMKPVITNSRPRTRGASGVATAATARRASGNTSRGQYTLLTSWLLVTRLWPPWFTEVEKKVQGSSPREGKRAEGAPDREGGGW